MNLMSLPGNNKLLYIAFTALFLLGALNLSKTTYTIFKSSQRLDDLKKQVNGLETDKQALQESIKYKSTQDFIEEQARNVLNLVKPGEKVYVAAKGIDNGSGLNVLGAQTHISGEDAGTQEDTALKPIKMRVH